MNNLVQNHQYMKKNLITLIAVLFAVAHLQAQVEPNAGNWKTWFITSGKDYRFQHLIYKMKLQQVFRVSKVWIPPAMQQILFWNAGAPGYRWQEMIGKIWVIDTSAQWRLANMLLGVATYDATIAALGY